MSTENIKGLKELQALLDTLPAKIEANIARGAMRAGIKVVVARAQQLAPEGPPSTTGAKKYGGRSGLLKESIRGSVRLKSKAGKLIGSVKAGGKVKSGGDAYYALMVEKGTKPHVIRAGKGKVLPLGRGVKSAKHPGARKQPFMRPALDEAGGDAVQAMAAYIRNRLKTKHGLEVPDPADPDIPDVADEA